MQQSDQTNSDLHVGAVVLVATAHISEPEDSELLAKRKSRFSRNRTGADVLEHGCNLRRKRSKMPNNHESLRVSSFIRMRTEPFGILETWHAN